MVTTTTLDFFNDPFFIGFDRQIKDLQSINRSTSHYPPHNLVKVVGSDDIYIIELAIAGFNKDNVEVEQDKNVLTVKGSADENETKEYLYKGIGGRSFVKTFQLAEYVQVVSASVLDGILQIGLMKIIPDSEKPKKFSITDLEDVFTPEEYVLPPVAKNKKK